jgi:hypothetical protein
MVREIRAKVAIRAITDGSGGVHRFLSVSGIVGGGLASSSRTISSAGTDGEPARNDRGEVGEYARVFPDHSS